MVVGFVMNCCFQVSTLVSWSCKFEKREMKRVFFCNLLVFFLTLVLDKGSFWSQFGEKNMCIFLMEMDLMLRLKWLLMLDLVFLYSKMLKNLLCILENISRNGVCVFLFFSFFPILHVQKSWRSRFYPRSFYVLWNIDSKIRLKFICFVCAYCLVLPKWSIFEIYLLCLWLV